MFLYRLRLELEKLEDDDDEDECNDISHKGASKELGDGHETTATTTTGGESVNTGDMLVDPVEMGAFVVKDRTPQTLANHTIHWHHAFAAGESSFFSSTSLTYTLILKLDTASASKEKNTAKDARREYLFHLATSCVSCAVLLGCAMQFMDKKPEDGFAVFELIVAFIVAFCAALAICCTLTLTHAVRAVSAANFRTFLRAENTIVLNKNLMGIMYFGCGNGFLILLAARLFNFAAGVIDNSLPNSSLPFRIVFAAVSGITILSSYCLATMRPCVMLMRWSWLVCY